MAVANAAGGAGVVICYPTSVLRWGAAGLVSFFVSGKNFLLFCVRRWPAVGHIHTVQGNSCWGTLAEEWHKSPTQCGCAAEKKITVSGSRTVARLVTRCWE